MKYLLEQIRKPTSDLSSQYQWVFLLDGGHFTSDRYTKEHLQSKNFISILLNECLTSAIVKTVSQHPYLTIDLCKTMLFEELQHVFTEKNSNKTMLILMDNIDDHEPSIISLNF